MCEENTKEFDFARLLTQFLKIIIRKGKEAFGDLRAFPVVLKFIMGPLTGVLEVVFGFLVTYLNFSDFVSRTPFLCFYLYSLQESVGVFILPQT